MCEFCGSAGVCVVCGYDHDGKSRAVGRRYRVICTQARKAGAIGVFGAVDVVVNAASANAAKEAFAEQYERRTPLMVFRK